MQTKLDFMIDIIQKIGDFQRTHFRTEIAFEEKVWVMDLVSFVDKECEKMFRDALSEKFPEDAIMGEESYDPNHDYKQHKNLWIIDPLDGTLMYQRWISIYACMIAYIENGVVQHSSIYLSELNELYYADSSGAYRDQKKIHVSTRKNLAESVFRISQSMLRKVIPDISKKEHFSLSLGKQINFYTGGYSFSLCAAGSIEGDMFYPNIGNIWDTVPGWFLVQQAGGRVTNFGSDSWDIFNPNVIFSNGLIHEEFQKLLES